MASESKKRLALAIIDFLNTSSTDGTLSSDESESIEVAKQIIADSFGVDPSNKAAVADALGGQTLLSIYGVFEKMKGKTTGGAAKPTPASTPSPEQKAQAESLKGQGNTAMAQKKYPLAIDLYTQALAIHPTNPIYLSNRAAAYSASHQHEKAALDAQAAVDSDPKYTKAWSRLGLARFALGDTKGSMQAYEKGMAAEGAVPSDPMRRGYETAKKRLEEEERGSIGGDDDMLGGSPERTASPGSRGMGGGGMPDLASLAGMFGGAGGGGGGGGGMPDLSSFMSNPMVAQMAQSVMKNPEMMNSLLNNPKLKQMMEGAGGGGGGMPDLGSLMSDPSIAEMAKSFMGGGGGGSSSGTGGSHP